MRIAVIGPGALGTLLAAGLQAGGARVRLLDHNAARAARLDAAGLCVEEPDGRAGRVAVPATSDPAAVGETDLAVLAVKATATAAAIRHAASLLERAGAVCTVQNGLGNAEQLAALRPDGRVVVGATSLGALALGEGWVRRTGTGPTLLAPFRPAAAEAARAAVRAWRAGGFEADWRPDPAAVLWSKLIVNAAINPVTALAGVTNGELLERPDLLEQALAAAAEAAAVARALGVTPEPPDAAAGIARVCRLTAANRSSMLRDRERGLPTEVEHINGAVVREGLRLGIPTPVNADLLERLRRPGASL